MGTIINEVSKLIILKSFLTLSLLTSYHTVEKEKFVHHAPKIISIDTDYPKDGIWVRIPNRTKLITVKVQADNTETVLFWIIPTGTQTWNQRKLIGYDTKENDKDNEFSLSWKIDKPSLLNHLHIQALGEGIANDVINLIME